MIAVSVDRTRDLQIFRLMLSHLSYSRNSRISITRELNMGAWVKTRYPNDLD